MMRAGHDRWNRWRPRARQRVRTAWLRRDAGCGRTTWTAPTGRRRARSTTLTGLRGLAYESRATSRPPMRLRCSGATRWPCRRSKSWVRATRPDYSLGREPGAVHCWPVHAGVGCAVTFTCSTRRRARLKTTNTPRHRGHDGEIDRYHLAQMRPEERAPPLRRRVPAPRKVLRDRRLGHRDAQLAQLPVDPRAPPLSVLSCRVSQQRAEPSIIVGTSPLRICRSVPQMVVLMIRTTASVGCPMAGRGFSSHPFLPGPW